MVDSKAILFVTFVAVVQMIGPAKLVPLVPAMPEYDNYLTEQEFLKSQYETVPKKVIPIYYMSRRGYNYERPQIHFEYGKVESGEVVEAFQGYVYDRPDRPFTYPPKTTTEFPPASARSII